jgi:hypothetical protein
MTLARVSLILALAAAAAIVTNVVLLNLASGAREPVGRLRFSTVRQSTTLRPAAPPPTTPISSAHDAREANDD